MQGMRVCLGAGLSMIFCQLDFEFKRPKLCLSIFGAFEIVNFNKALLIQVRTVGSLCSSCIGHL